MLTVCKLVPLGTDLVSLCVRFLVSGGSLVQGIIEQSRIEAFSNLVNVTRNCPLPSPPRKGEGVRLSLLKTRTSRLSAKTKRSAIELSARLS